MKTKKTNILEIKNIIICVGDEKQVIQLTAKEKFKRSKKELKEQCNNMLMKIKEYKSKTEHILPTKTVENHQNKANQQIENAIMKESLDILSNSQMSENDSIDNYESLDFSLKDWSL